MAFKEELEEAAAEYVADIELEDELTSEEQADIKASVQEDFMAGASQLAHLILCDINEGRSWEDITKQLIELDDMAGE